jgi:hypothetical protein
MLRRLSGWPNLRGNPSCNNQTSTATEALGPKYKEFCTTFKVLSALCQVRGNAGATATIRALDSRAVVGVANSQKRFGALTAGRA